MEIFTEDTVLNTHQNALISIAMIIQSFFAKFVLWATCLKNAKSNLAQKKLARKYYVKNQQKFRIS